LRLAGVKSRGSEVPFSITMACAKSFALIYTILFLSLLFLRFPYYRELLF